MLTSRDIVQLFRPHGAVVGVVVTAARVGTHVPTILAGVDAVPTFRTPRSVHVGVGDESMVDPVEGNGVIPVHLIEGKSGGERQVSHIALLFHTWERGRLETDGVDVGMKPISVGNTHHVLLSRLDVGNEEHVSGEGAEEACVCGLVNHCRFFPFVDIHWVTVWESNPYTLRLGHCYRVLHHLLCDDAALLTPTLAHTLPLVVLFGTGEEVAHLLAHDEPLAHLQARLGRRCFTVADVGEVFRHLPLVLPFVHVILAHLPGTTAGVDVGELPRGVEVSLAVVLHVHVDDSAPLLADGASQGVNVGLVAILCGDGIHHGAVVVDEEGQHGDVVFHPTGGIGHVFPCACVSGEVR